MNRISDLTRPFTDTVTPTRDSAFRADVIAGLSAAPQKTLPCKYFYDTCGAQLFDAICRTPEYYVTRTEMGLLHKHAVEIAGLAGASAQLIEFGSGGATKACVLLDRLRRPAAYIPIDICPANLFAELRALALRYPGLAVVPLRADFTRPLKLPEIAGGRQRVGFFPGSTIGNFAPEDAKTFLRQIARVLGPDGLLVIGVDIKKPARILDAAYNDAAGVTAAFNLNLLKRINRELGGTFDLDAFSHCAHYNDALGRVEMHLYSLAFQSVRVDSHMFSFTSGESIHTENSYKYAPEEFQALARDSGFRPVKMWLDDAKMFSLHCLSVGTLH
jgi:L-histidine N-alpha-methyltransferase